MPSLWVGGQVESWVADIGWMGGRVGGNAPVTLCHHADLVAAKHHYHAPNLQYGPCAMCTGNLPRGEITTTRALLHLSSPQRKRSAKHFLPTTFPQTFVQLRGVVKGEVYIGSPQNGAPAARPGAACQSHFLTPNSTPVRQHHVLNPA